MIQRTIERIDNTDMHRGFLGEGHMAAAVVDGNDFARTDPFIILMDDRLDLPGGEPVGGAHPHAGFETVTLVLEGDDTHWKTGSLEVMTAGKGIIHTEEITSKTKMHILQLWLVLPPDKRWAEPAWQEIQAEHVPTVKTANAEIRVYSGSSNGLTSPLQNNTPFTLVDFNLSGNTAVVQQIPSTYNGFVYVVKGEVWIGDRKIAAGQSGWLNRSSNSGKSEIRFETHDANARFVLYAGEPQGAPIVSHGPFIGDNRNDIVRLYNEYHRGLMPHLNELDARRKTHHTKAA